MFRIGAARYAVRVVEGPIRLEGAQCVGICDEEGQEVGLASTLPVERRLHVLLHELAHGHVFATGMPRDVESLCDFVATVGELAFRDLAACGGEESLRRLRPGEVLGRATGRIGLLRARACSCGGLIAPGDVRCEQDRARPDQVTLSLYCEHCDHTLTWNELATFGGLPSGVVVGEPRIERGNTVAIPS
jgi:hypothetical protein